MKKTSIEILLLLSAGFSRKEIGDLLKDAKALNATQTDLVLTQLEAHKTKSLSTMADVIGAELEKKKLASGTAEEVQYLLLTSYKLKVPVAAERLSARLASMGIHVTFDDRPSKPNFVKWLVTLCEEHDKEKVMSATLSLRPHD